jgi:hypothetical protein
LLENTRVARFLSTHHKEFLAGFQQVIVSASLEE